MKRKRKKKNKNKIIIITMFLLVIAILISYFIYKSYKEKNSLNVELNKELTAEINSKTNLKSFIKKINNGTLLTKDYEIDTSTLGKEEITLLIKNNFGEVETYNFDIDIIDTTKPIINGAKDLTSYTGKEINLLKDVSATDNSNEEITISVDGTYDINKEGTYLLNYIAKDSSGNTITSEFTLKVIKDPNNYTFTTTKGYTAKVINGITYIDGILIANKTYSLPSNYGSGLTKETLNAFNLMKADASALGLNLYISSGYRSYYDQKYIYNNYVKRDGQANADTYSARAGHSEHQTGLAFDLNEISDYFTTTPEGIWVKDNCYKYGLILRYPKGKDNITGYMHESWHLRYVGTELSEKLYNNGDWITLEEHFGITSKYN